MKKFLYLLCVFIICSAFNCEDEPLQGEFVTADAACNQAQIDAANAALVFLNATDENYTVICNQYKDALEVQIAVCGDETGAIQSLIDQLGDCSPPVDNSNACQDAIIAKNEAEVAFNNSTDQNYNELCNELKDAIQLVIDTCGTTVELQNQLDGLGNCILTTNNASLIGTWRIISLTSNGVEELPGELQAANICYWEETYTETTMTDTEFSGANCDMEYVVDVTEYELSNNIITYANGADPVEVIELTDTTLRYQEEYMEGGETFLDIYTYERQD